MNGQLLEIAHAAVRQDAAARRSAAAVSAAAEAVADKEALLAECRESLTLSNGWRVDAKVKCDLLAHGYMQLEKDFNALLPEYTRARTAAQQRGGGSQPPRRSQSMRSDEPTSHA